jgi:hypothetical protein
VTSISARSIGLSAMSSLVITRPVALSIEKCPRAGIARSPVVRISVPVRSSWYSSSHRLADFRLLRNENHGRLVGSSTVQIAPLARAFDGKPARVGARPAADLLSIRLLGDHADEGARVRADVVGSLVENGLDVRRLRPDEHRSSGDN